MQRYRFDSKKKYGGGLYDDRSAFSLTVTIEKKNLRNNLKMKSCSCSVSEFLYAPCGHIVTGDLNIDRNEKLTDLLHKGPK